MRIEKWARERQEKREDERPSAVVQGAAGRKNGLCEGSAQGNWHPRKDQQPFWVNPTESGTAPPR